MRPLLANIGRIQDGLHFNDWKSSTGIMNLPVICRNMLRGAFVVRRSSVRLLQTTAVCHKVVAGRVRVSKGEKPVTYEQAHAPHYIGVRKGWNSKHTANLEGEIGTADRTLEDLFIRKFMFGTFHNCLATELIIKRRANQIFIAAIMLRNQAPQKYYFLIGYTEELLSHWFKCPVKLEIQIVEDKPVYKWI